MVANDIEVGEWKPLADAAFFSGIHRVSRFVKIVRTDNRIQIDCDSETEIIKVFSAVLASQIASADHFGIWPQGMLSTLDDVTKQLERGTKSAAQDFLQGKQH